MPVLSTVPDPDTLTFTLVAELAAPPEQVWLLWSDPRRLERWWGPPTWPATFVEHDLRVGGRSHYFMTGPDGTQSHGWWRVTAVDEPRSFEFEDGFADSEGNPTDAVASTPGRVGLEATDAGTRMTVVSRFQSPEHLQQMVEMGMVEGITAAVNQMDDLLASS
jgi:uncharacterized protein YndB with AHSA1/START domain